MSSNEDYGPRSSRRERPRYNDGPGLTYPEEEVSNSTSRRPRNDASPRRQRDADPRDLEPAVNDKKLPREYQDHHTDRGADPRRSNVAVRRRGSYSDDEVDHSRDPRRDGGGAAYGRSKGYREPVPEPDYHRDRDLDRAHSTRRPRDRDEYNPEPIQRSKSTREPDRHRRDDPYHGESRPRRQDDRYGDHDRGYRSDGRDGYAKRRDGDRDRIPRRDDGYTSDRAHRRERDRDRDRERDRDRDRYTDRDRDRRRHDSDREHRDRDRRDRDRDYDRDRDRDRDKPKKKGFGMGDVNKLYEQGQKHYKTVAPLIEKVAKMYMDSKGGGGGGGR